MGLPNRFIGGTNYNFTQFNLSSSVEENKIKKDEEYYLIMISYPKNKEEYIKLNTTFSPSPLFWNVSSFHENNCTNKSTEETINLVKEILKNDSSSKDDYVKLGKWVHKNMNFNCDYSGQKLTISDILRIKQGVCKHYTELYNSLLNSMELKHYTLLDMHLKN